MTSTSDRRADSTRRVPVEALVEVCGVGGKVTPFEAESADVSGRGIRLRTAYLPEAGAPVVCRFENGGQEVIAEGVVAWCQKETRGGEFGVRFTALDARSAEILRGLCGIEENERASDEDAADVAPERVSRKVTPGTKVKLHIEGLGSPMRARIDEGKGARISVGSTLEFLKIGRKLEMESVDDGTKREARIDGLDITIDPTTGVPRLLVLLKTDGDEDTPQPSVVDTARRHRAEAERAESTRTSASRTVKEPGEKRADAKPAESPSQEDIDEQVELMVGRMRRIAGSARRKVSDVTVQLGAQLGPSMGRAFQNMRQLSFRNPREPVPARRKTAPAPSAAPTGSERKLRPQNRASQSSEPEIAVTKFYQQAKFKRTAGVVAAAGLLATVIAVASRGPSSASSTATIGPDSIAAVQPVANAATPTLGAVAAGASNSAPGNGLVAQVPLFGPTPMATIEAAPQPAPAGESPDAVAAREMALAKSAHAGMPSGTDPLAAGSEEPAGEASEEPATKPEDVAPWGKGKMKDPTLYRIKIDGPGEAIKGTTQPKGFSVIIPGRKAAESPKGFVSKDPRFAKISAQNLNDGVKITWLFKDEPPPYRVRLRKSNVEILISEGAKSKPD